MEEGRTSASRTTTAENDFKMVNSGDRQSQKIRFINIQPEKTKGEPCNEYNCERYETLSLEVSL
jgi:hypothetical protein